MKDRIKWFPAILVFMIVLVNCTKSDEYKKYAPDGEILYLQRAYSVKTYPGKNRVQLEWVLVDPKVTSCKVFYEQGGIQGDITVTLPTYNNRENDTIRIMISDLVEAFYSFKIISYDDLGHASIPVEAEEQVYGEEYEKSLLNSIAKNTTYNSAENSLTIEWGTSVATVIGVNLTYTDINGDNQSLLIDPSESITTIQDFKLGEPLLCSAMHKPVPESIDIFSTDWQRIYIGIISNVVLKKPVTSSGSATPAYTEINAVDGDRTSSASRWISAGPYASPDLSPPQWLEVDLQGFYAINGFGMWRDAGAITGSQSFSLQAWVENDWVDVVSEINNVQTVYYAEFISVTTDKVRLYIRPTVWADYLIRLFEIEVYSVIKY